MRCFDSTLTFQGKSKRLRMMYQEGGERAREAAHRVGSFCLRDSIIVSIGYRTWCHALDKVLLTIDLDESSCTDNLVSVQAVTHVLQCNGTIFRKALGTYMRTTVSSEN